MYTPLRIYEVVGKFDKVATLSFKTNSAAYKDFGNYINVVFVYTQAEREALDAQLAASENGEASGYIKARYLGYELPLEKQQLLTLPGILSSDISSMQAAAWTSKKNTFHSTDTRTLNKIEIPFRNAPKGGDYNWMYGFDKTLWADGEGFSPFERCEFLTRKLYFEPELLTHEENQEIHDENGLKQNIEREYLAILYFREEINAEQKKRLLTLVKKKHAERLASLDVELKKIGSSNRKLVKANGEKAGEIALKFIQFKERRLNVKGKRAIYLDLTGYLHIWMCHVEEMKINGNFVHKDNYQWEEPDVIRVMGEIIELINDEAQAFFETTPNTRFSKYGPESIYYEGDYYTLHVEPSGRIATYIRIVKRSSQSKEQRVP